MSRFATTLLFACACNRVLGLDQAELIDARYFDAGTDASFTCPAIGETPRFARFLTQVVLQPVHEYTTSLVTGHATARSLIGIMEGFVDDTMTLAAGFPSGAGCGSCDDAIFPRLTPEGDGVYVVLASSMFGTYVVELFQRSSNTWSSVQSFPGLANQTFIGSVTRGPLRRLMAIDTFGDLREFELADSGSTTVVAKYTAAELGLTAVRTPMLGADGLRMLLVGQGDGNEGVYYADRADLTQRFSPARVLDGVAVGDSPFLTADCSRIYVTGLSSVFYARRE